MPAPLSSRFRLTPADFVALIDDREKRPLSLFPLRVEFARLVTGDYTIKGLQQFVAVERKSLLDLIHGLRTRRCQLESQIQRLLAIPTRLLVIEATPLEIDQGAWPNRNLVTPQFVWEKITEWEIRGLQVALTGTHQRAGRRVANFLRQAANKYFDKFHPFIETIEGCGCNFTPLGTRPNRVPGVGLSQTNSIINQDPTNNPPPVSSKQSLPLSQKRAA